MVEPDEIAGLDGEAACGALGRVRSALVAAEVTELFLVAHWADLHPGEEVEERRRTRRSHGRRSARGSERGRQIGADGTPLVAEFSVMELGAHLGLGVHAARAYVRDALNVRHRHPVMWARLGRARELGPAPAPAAADSTTADSTAGGTSSAGTVAATPRATPPRARTPRRGRGRCRGCGRRGRWPGCVRTRVWTGTRRAGWTR